MSGPELQDRIWAKHWVHGFRGEIGTWASHNDDGDRLEYVRADQPAAAIARAERAEANAAKLAEALRPFAEALRGNYSHQSDDMLISMGHGADDLRWVLPLGDFRRAVAALAALEGGDA